MHHVNFYKTINKHADFILQENMDGSDLDKLLRYRMSFLFSFRFYFDSRCADNYIVYI